MIYDLIVVGGGVSGVTAAITLKRKNPNSKVLIIEAQDDLLKKLAVTGNGKCNFTNGKLDSKFYNNGSFFKELINSNTDKILSFIDSLNIAYYMDESNRYYPYSNSAKTIRYKMINELNKDEYVLNECVYDISKEDNFKVLSKDNTGLIKTYTGKNVLIASALKNYRNKPSECIVSALEKLGHGFTDIYPSDIYIKVKEKEITKRFTGLRVNAALTLYNGDAPVHQEKGEILFKDDAVSGIVSFNVSNTLAGLYKDHKDKDPYLLIDFVPLKSGFELKEEYDSLGKNLFYNKYLHPVIANDFIKNKDYVNIKSFRLNVKSLGDFDNAQVACGGIRLNEINKMTLESNIVKGLYFSGDIIDISAPCGGYNLSFAFLSGLKVGEEIE